MEEGEDGKGDYSRVHWKHSAGVQTLNEKHVSDLINALGSNGIKLKFHADAADAQVYGLVRYAPSNQ